MSGRHTNGDENVAKDGLPFIIQRSAFIIQHSAFSKEEDDV
jgi:hypothetical protein